MPYGYTPDEQLNTSQKEPFGFTSGCTTRPMRHQCSITLFMRESGPEVTYDLTTATTATAKEEIGGKGLKKKGFPSRRQCITCLKGCVSRGLWSHIRMLNFIDILDRESISWATEVGDWWDAELSALVCMFIFIYIPTKEGYSDKGRRRRRC